MCECVCVASAPIWVPCMMVPYVTGQNRGSSVDFKPRSCGFYNADKVCVGRIPWTASFQAAAISLFLTIFGLEALREGMSFGSGKQSAVVQGPVVMVCVPFRGSRRKVSVSSQVVRKSSQRTNQRQQSTVASQPITGKFAEGESAP